MYSCLFGFRVFCSNVCQLRYVFAARDNGIRMIASANVIPGESHWLGPGQGDVELQVLLTEFSCFCGVRVSCAGWPISICTPISKVTNDTRGGSGLPQRPGYDHLPTRAHRLIPDRAGLPNDQAHWEGVGPDHPGHAVSIKALKDLLVVLAKKQDVDEDDIVKVRGGQCQIFKEVDCLCLL